MEESYTSSGWAILGRGSWMLFGPAAMFTAAAVMLTGPHDWWSTPSWIYLAALFATLAGRWLEFAGGTPLDSDGKPTTSAYLKSWTLIVAGSGIAVWVVIRLLSGL